jgi:IMP dehydrogenase
MGYCGCRTVPALQKNGSFTRVSPAGMREGHPHDVKIIKEAPNYSLNA